MAYNRELSQFASLVEVNDTSKKIGISTDLTVSGILTASYFYGSGRFLTDIIATSSPGGTEGQLQYNTGTDTDGAEIYYNPVNQNVGIGSTIPISKLDVSGDGKFTGIVTASSFVGNVNGNITGTSGNFSGIVTASSFVGNGSQLTGVGAGLSVSDDTSTNGIFYPVLTQTTVGLASTGRVSTTKLSFNPSTGTLTATKFSGDGSGLTGTGSTVFNNTTTNQEFFPLFTNITTGTITASGISTSKLTYNPSTGTLTVIDLNSTSDITLKENIHTVENPLETISSLRGVSFDWKENGKSSYGVIAQELEEVLPELVKTGEVKSVNYNGLIGILIEGMKSQQEQINRLEQKIQELTK